MSGATSIALVILMNLGLIYTAIGSISAVLFSCEIGESFELPAELYAKQAIRNKSAELSSLAMPRY